MGHAAVHDVPCACLRLGGSFLPAKPGRLISDQMPRSSAQLSWNARNVTMCHLRLSLCLCLR
jgi:hypothetical protein